MPIDLVDMTESFDEFHNNPYGPPPYRIKGTIWVLCRGDNYFRGLKAVPRWNPNLKIAFQFSDKRLAIAYAIFFSKYNSLVCNLKEVEEAFFHTPQTPSTLVKYAAKEEKVLTLAQWLTTYDGITRKAPEPKLIAPPLRRYYR